MSHCEILVGDCLGIMRTFPDNHFSAIVTDPPYGLSFMGKGWDHEVPKGDIWRESYRISKPGSFLLAMGGTRTSHRLFCHIEDAGWEIRDCLMWIYGSGFPKSHNFGRKGHDSNSEGGVCGRIGRNEFEGYGTALKPAYEPIIMAMKPCDGTFKQNAEKWGQAGINIDGCRIKNGESTLRPNGSKGEQYCGGYAGVGIGGSNTGRWPANVILDEEAAAMLDEQSGISISRPDNRNGSDKKDSNCYHGGWKHAPNYVADSGGASRFFYCAKASSSERNEGLEGLPYLEAGIKNDSGRGFSESDPHKSIQYKNNHPTVKPLKLMQYLIKLVMPPENGLLLDPFAGSGTTILAAKQLGFDAIGIEKSPEYCEIARKRIA